MLLGFAIPFVFVLAVLFGVSSYLVAEHQLVETAKVGIRDTLLQTKNYLDNRIGDVFELFLNIEESPSLLAIRRDIASSPNQNYSLTDYLELNRDLGKAFATYHTMLDSIYVDSGDGRCVIFKTDSLVTHVGYDVNEWQRRYPDNQYRWLGLHRDTLIQTSPPNQKVASVFHLSGDAASELHGLVCFNLREDFFQNILAAPQLSDHGYMMVISAEDASSFKAVDNKYQLSQSNIDWLRASPQTMGQMFRKTQQGVSLLVSFDTLNLPKWRIVAIVPEAELLQKADVIKVMTILLILCLALVGVVLSLLLARNLTRPVETLATKIDKLYSGACKVSFDVRGFQEIVFLNNVIGDLVHRVDNLVQRVRQEQDQKKQAEFAVLQAQINPHFLYNTLYSAQQLCVMGNQNEAADMIEALSTFFRIGLSEGLDLIPLSQELEHVRSYLVIQAMKYGDIFAWDIQVESQYAKLKIVKLTLQPLVENAIYHGLKEKSGFGHLLISAEAEEEDVLIVVRDNGEGMENTQVDALNFALEHKNERQAGKAFGLMNVHDRLRLHFGEPYGLSLYSSIHNGTQIHVKIPGVRQ